MSQHDPYVAIQHMRDYAGEAITLASGCTADILQKDRVRMLALTHLVLIVGEAATRVPASIRSRYPEVKWREIVGARNRLIHGYDTVDMDVLWLILTLDLPKLIEALGPSDITN